jgi:mono/diheme cytochrome c family protein
VKANLKVAAICCLAASMATPGFAQDSGADIYKLKCAMCHGVDGTANTPAGKVFKAASFSDPAIVKISDADRIPIVKKGKDKMPPFGDKLTDDQIKAVLAYVRTLQK